MKYLVAVLLLTAASMANAGLIITLERDGRKNNKGRQRVKAKILACLMAMFAADASAMPINLVDYFTIGPNLIDFETFSVTSVNLSNRDGIVALGNGVTIGERFLGQTVSGNIVPNLESSESGSLNDALSGSPSSPLTLVAGAAGANLSIGVPTGIATWGNSSLLPCGPATCAGMSGTDGIGEGAFAVLFAAPVSEFGFQATFASLDGPDTFVNVFAMDGNLIDSVVVSADASGFGAVAVDSFGFRRAGGALDILGFSVHNFDQGGLAFDNIRYGAASVSVPEPGTLSLLGMGLLSLVFARRNRRPLIAVS